MAKTTCCNIHPFHCQNTGVCSYCLCDRLNDLSPPPKFYASQSIQVVAASYSSGPSSCPASPPRRRHNRNSSGVIGFLVTGGRVGLRKSRSIAFVSSRSRGAGAGVAGGKKRGGFWSKLLRSSSSLTVKRSNDVLKHSRTVK